MPHASARKLWRSGDIHVKQSLPAGEALLRRRDRSSTPTRRSSGRDPGNGNRGRARPAKATACFRGAARARGAVRGQPWPHSRGAAREDAEVAGRRGSQPPRAPSVEAPALVPAPTNSAGESVHAVTRGTRGTGGTGAPKRLASRRHLRPAARGTSRVRRVRANALGLDRCCSARRPAAAQPVAARAPRTGSR